MVYDVIIIGAGAAGLMTAITAARGNLRVLLLEGQNKVGAKILMSGGTRCNVTNKEVLQKDFNSRQIIVVRNILRSFTNEDTIAFFKGLGVELLLEPTGKYFPTTHSGKTVLDALLGKIKESGVSLMTGHKVHSVSVGNDGFIVRGEGFDFEARKVVLTTGGLSYPSTGSDGVGYRIAQSFGHQVLETFPALTPLKTEDEGFKALSGITLVVKLALSCDGKSCFSGRDSFLFTHFGFSGPIALDISRHWLNGKRQKHLTANFIPDHNENSLQNFLTQARQKAGHKTIKHLLGELMPERLALLLLKRSGIKAEDPVNQLEKKLLRGLIIRCLQFPLEISGVLGYSKAEVTAGGVDLSQINPKTLESNLIPGLFFAGEILDVDGRIGGFNFQWAWASGHTVGEALIKQISSGRI